MKHAEPVYLVKDVEPVYLVKQVRKPLALSQSLVSGPSGVEKHVSTDAGIKRSKCTNLCFCINVISLHLCIKINYKKRKFSKGPVCFPGPVRLDTSRSVVSITKEHDLSTSYLIYDKNGCSTVDSKLDYDGIRI